MFADLFLQFCVLHFCFTSQDRKEIREKQKEKKKTAASQPEDQQTGRPTAACPCTQLLCYKTLI
jgi:hypothetical protein